MNRPATPTAPSLYVEDETAWLELTSRLVAERRFDEVDADSLSEYLSDMATRDRREAKSRLVVLLAHLLKWEHQPSKRSASWESTIATQRGELGDLLESRTLRLHATTILEQAYRRAVLQATIQTGLPESTFPATCPYDLDAILGEND